MAIQERSYQGNLPRKGAPIFEKCFVVNLDKDTERLQRMAKRLQNIGIEWERFSAVTPPQDLPAYQVPELMPGHWACGLSHLMLLKKIYILGYKTTLILEDDCILRDDILQELERARHEIEELKWDILYLGCHTIKYTPGYYIGYLRRVDEAYHTHAYMVRHEAIPDICQSIQRSLQRFKGPFDSFSGNLSKWQFQDTMAIQEPGYSYTVGRYKDRTTQYFPNQHWQVRFRNHCKEFRDQTRLGVVTLWNDNFKDIAEITLPTKRKYCKRWKLPYREQHGRIYKDRPAAWSKIPLILRELPRYDWIFWTDADAMFMRDDVELQQYLDDGYDLIWTEDKNGPNTGNFFIRNSPACEHLLNQADKLFGQTKPEDSKGRFHGQWEQAAIREIVDNGTDVRIKTIDKRSINSYDTDYCVGDFILHLPGKFKRERMSDYISFIAL